MQKKIPHIGLLLLLLFTGVILAQPSQETDKTKVDIQSGYLERKPELPDAFIYTQDTEGQVYIVHEGIKMWCNQAYVYLKDNFVKAYGEVKIKQGDTISMNSNYAEYNGNTQFAFASGDVIFKEPQTTLKTDTLYFDRVKIQGGAGFIEPTNDYLAKVKQRCQQVGALLILDEIQPGFGRTGKLFGFMNYNVVPDILVMGKGMGGGLPIGAFTASKLLMDLLQEKPKLGHITTFGGNAVIAAAALATLKEITQSSLMQEALEKEILLRSLLVHKAIKEIRGTGLMLALIMETPAIANQVILRCKDKNLILFWLLFEPRAIRISPPLTISNAEIIEGCTILSQVLNEI